MAQITLHGTPIQTSGDLPAVGSTVPALSLVDTGLKTVSLEAYSGVKVLNIFPSIDTGICALSVKAFNAKAGGKEGVAVLNISADLPFAHGRFCGAEGIEDAVSLSTFRSDFAKEYGLEIVDGPLAGLCARAVLVLDANNTVLYAELVPEIGQEPNYEAALSTLS